VEVVISVLPVDVRVGVSILRENVQIIFSLVVMIVSVAITHDGRFMYQCVPAVCVEI
jgi:hypothetical protein